MHINRWQLTQTHCDNVSKPQDDINSCASITERLSLSLKLNITKSLQGHHQWYKGSSAKLWSWRWTIIIGFRAPTWSQHPHGHTVLFTFAEKGFVSNLDFTRFFCMCCAVQTPPQQLFLDSLIPVKEFIYSLKPPDLVHGLVISSVSSEEHECWSMSPTITVPAVGDQWATVLTDLEQFIGSGADLSNLPKDNRSSPRRRSVGTHRRKSFDPFRYRDSTRCL